MWREAAFIYVVLACCMNIIRGGKVEVEDCSEKHWDFHIKGLSCEQGLQRIFSRLDSEATLRACIDTEKIQLIDGCDAIVTMDYVYNRIRIFCDAEDHTVCFDPSNG